MWSRQEVIKACTKNFPKGQVRERTELAHGWRQGRGVSVPGEGRWAPLPSHQHPAGFAPAGATVAHSGVTPVSMAQLPAAHQVSSLHLLQGHICFPKGSSVEGSLPLGHPCNLEGRFSQVALKKLPLGSWPKGRHCRKDLGALVNGKLSESVCKVRVCLSWAPSYFW